MAVELVAAQTKGHPAEKLMLSIEGIERLIEPVVAQLGLVMHGIELKKEGRDLVLRIVVDRAEKANASDGITVDELAHASDEIGALLDLENPIESRYRLTLESPGIERDLQTWRHFKYAVGEKVRIVTRGEEAAVYEGELVSANDDNRHIEVNTKDGRVEIDATQIKSARTIFEWEIGEKRKF
ncbi:MAG: hypothetical protein II767_08140 [Proteobacteria bacterium]|nr:hypothetical protein [Pseudomonadota bacterium]